MGQIILLIETSTNLCSAAMAEDGKIVCYRESAENRAHASLTAVFVDEMLKERGCTLKDCTAVCISEGPGSYTGLRVGVSTAKGLCFGADIPLLSVGTLEVLVNQALQTINGIAAPGGEVSRKVGADESEALTGKGCAGRPEHIVPMIDARRMEVYTAVFDGKGARLTPTEAKVIDSDSFSGLLEQGPVLFIGDGAGKCEGTITHPNARFIQTCPRASAMLEPALEELKEKRFRDVAYFEPFYLKDFIVTPSKKQLF